MAHDVKEQILMPSTIETIDRAFYEFCDEKMNIFCTTNKGWKKVPVIWISAERSHQIKHNKNLRNSDGLIILPAITIERTAVVKDLSKRGATPSDVPPYNDEKGGSIIIARRINQVETSKFSNNRSEKTLGAGKTNRRERNTSVVLTFGKNSFTVKNRNPVYETISIPMPVYLDINYSINIKAEYQQQANEIITPFMTKTGGINYFLLKKDGHRYEAFIQGNFNQENNISSLGEEERRYEIKFDIKVLGYIMGADKNQERPKITIRQSMVDVKINRERTIYGDISDFTDSPTYRGPSPEEHDKGIDDG